ADEGLVDVLRLEADRVEEGPRGRAVPPLIEGTADQIAIWHTVDFIQVPKSPSAFSEVGSQRMLSRIALETPRVGVIDVPLLRYTRWALAITAAALPLYVVKWQIGPLSTTPLEVVIVITVALYAITATLHDEVRPRRTPYEIPIALFIVAGVIGIFVAP